MEAAGRSGTPPVVGAVTGSVSRWPPGAARHRPGPIARRARPRGGRAAEASGRTRRVAPPQRTARSSESSQPPLRVAAPATPCFAGRYVRPRRIVTSHRRVEESVGEPTARRARASRIASPSRGNAWRMGHSEQASHAPGSLADQGPGTPRAAHAEASDGERIEFGLRVRSSGRRRCTWIIRTRRAGPVIPPTASRSCDPTAGPRPRCCGCPRRSATGEPGGVRKRVLLPTRAKRVLLPRRSGSRLRGGETARAPSSELALESYGRNEPRMGRTVWRSDRPSVAPRSATCGGG